MKMNYTYMISSDNINFHYYLNSYYAYFEEQVTRIVVEILLIIGMIWIILKRSPEPSINLDKAEEEALISEYTPDSLVPEISPTHPALNQKIVKGKIGTKIKLEGVEHLNFACHDYLGFIGNKTIEENAKKCVDIYGVGSCGPRGFYGTTVLHLELERLLAEFMETEDSIIFSYGFATMATAIPAYAKKNDIVFADEKCNYAIQQGIRASKSEVKFFKHNDMRDLERILEETRVADLLNVRKARKSRRHLVVEGIYFNTGEICDLVNLITLCKKYKLRIFMDESISFGVLGKTGRGITEYFGVPRGDVDLIMGSFEFSFASTGGFCTGARFLVDHLYAAALGYTFSASLPPLLVQASIDALEEIKNHPEKMEELKAMSNLMHEKLISSNLVNELFIVSGNKDSPIHVLTLRECFEHGEEDEVIDELVEFCSARCVAITRATYLADSDTALTTPSIRVTTNVNHTEKHISYFIFIFECACRSLME